MDKRKVFIQAQEDSLMPVAFGMETGLKISGCYVSSNCSRWENGNYEISQDLYYHPIDFWSRWDRLVVILKDIGEVSFKTRLLAAYGEKFGMPVSVYQFDGVGLHKLEISWRNGAEVLQRIKEDEDYRRVYTINLKSINIDADYGSTALWVRGANLSYDFIDLPFDFVRRLQRWAEVYERFLWPEEDDILEEISNWFDCEQQRLAQEFRKLHPHIKVIANRVW